MCVIKSIYIFVLVPPLFVIEFLHRVFDTFIDYFSECNEQVINEQIVVVYEVNIYLLYLLIWYVCALLFD